MIRTIGKSVSWVNLILVLLIGTDVVLRYIFSTTPTWIVELEWHLFALIFLLAAAWSLDEDRHVRVDIFYDKWPKKRKLIFNIFGHLFLLIPWCLVIIYTSYFVARRSFLINETSPNAGGLPFLWIIKYCITLGFVLLLIHSVRQLVSFIKELYTG